MRWPAWRPGGPASSATWSAWTGPGRRPRCSTRRRHRGDRPRRPAGPAMIRQGAFAVEPWCLRETDAGPGSAGPEPSRCSRWRTGTWAGGATWTRASRTGCRAATSTGSTSCRPLPYAEGGYGFPESGADGHQRDQRQADPAVRRRRAVRRPVRRAARARADARLPRRRAEPAAPSGCRRPDRRSGSPRSGWCPSPSGRSRRSATTWSRSTARRGSRCSPSCWRTSSCRPPGGDPRVAAVLESPLMGEYQNADGSGRRARAHDAAQRAAGRRRRWIT